MSPASSRLIVAGACAIAIMAIVAQAQYSGSNNFDSDSNSELGKLVRNSGRIQAQNQRLNQQAAAAVAAATRNLHNHHQPLQYSPSHHRGSSSNYGASSGTMRGDEHQAYGPLSGLAGAHNIGAQGRSGSSSGPNSDMDDDEGSSFGPGAFDGPQGFNGQSGANQNDDGEGSQLDGPTSSLDKAASGGYPSSQGDYNNNDGAGFNFDGANFGPSSADGADFGPSEANFGGHHEGKRAKSASSPMSSRNFGSGDDGSDAGAPQYGPNSAINADGDEVVDGRAGYAPQGDNDNDGDDE